MNPYRRNPTEPNYVYDYAAQAKNRWRFRLVALLSGISIAALTVVRPCCLSREFTIAGLSIALAFSWLARRAQAGHVQGQLRDASRD